MCLVCLFTLIQWSILDGARQGRFSLSPVMILVFLVAIFGGVGWYIAAMIRAGRPGSSS
jgi:hypothetical protein